MTKIKTFIGNVRGPQGLDGRAFTLKGQYPSLIDLKNEHPTGEEGDAWSVGSGTEDNEIYVWNSTKNDWDSIGSIRGPQGPAQDLSDYIRFEVVNELPSIGEDNLIYLLPSEDENEFIEYIWLNNDWEQIGEKKLDLTDYFTKTEIQTLLDDKLNEEDLLEVLNLANVALSGNYNDLINKPDIPKLIVKEKNDFKASELPPGTWGGIY